MENLYCLKMKSMMHSADGLKSIFMYLKHLDIRQGLN